MKTKIPAKNIRNAFLSLTVLVLFGIIIRITPLAWLEEFSPENMYYFQRIQTTTPHVGLVELFLCLNCYFLARKVEELEEKK